MHYKRDPGGRALKPRTAARPSFLLAPANETRRALLYITIPEDEIFLRGSFPPRFLRSLKLGVFTKGNKGNKESQFLPWSFVPFVAFCKIRTEEWIWLQLHRTTVCAGSFGRRRRGAAVRGGPRCSDATPGPRTLPVAAFARSWRASRSVRRAFRGLVGNGRRPAETW